MLPFLTSSFPLERNISHLSAVRVNWVLKTKILVGMFLFSLTASCSQVVGWQSTLHVVGVSGLGPGGIGVGITVSHYLRFWYGGI